MKKLFRRIRYWAGSRRAKADLAEEMEFHRALKQEELERNGMSAKDAAGASRRVLGNTLRGREEAHDVWGWTWLDDAIRDAGYAFRTILRTPALSAVVVLSLGIGIGVNSAVFSWIERFVLRPVAGVDHPSEFYLIEPRSESGSYPGSSWTEYNDLRDRLRSFREVFASRMAPFTVGEGNQGERRTGLFVSDNYFSGLGLKPALGRFWRPDEASERRPAAVISYRYWKAAFNGDPKVLEQTIRANDQVLTIIGILPEGFQGTALIVDFDLWLPATLASTMFPGTRELEDRGMRSYSMMARLRDGVSREVAQAEFANVMNEFARLYPESNKGFGAEVLPYWQMPRGPQRFLATGLMVLQGIMLVLLLAVCGNAANLLLARAATRSREIGTRLAIGATRWRVARLLMTESLIIGLAGSAVGVAIAMWATSALRSVRFTMAFPIYLETFVDWRVLLFAVLLGTACALAFGTAPALQLARGDVQAKLRPGMGVAPQKRLRNLLMGLEAGLALMVLLAAALFFESFRDTQTLDPGFQMEGVLLTGYDLGGTAGHIRSDGSVEPAFSRSFATQLLDRLREVPGIESAAIGSSVPLDIHGMPLLRSFRVEGRTENSDTPDRSLVNFVTPGYLQTMRIPLAAGTDFAPMNDTTTPAQAIVNEEFVRRYIQNAEPVGRRIESGRGSFVIAGVAKNSFYDAVGEAPIPIVYLSYRTQPRTAGDIHVRTRPGAELLVANEVRRAVAEVQTGLPVFNVRTLGEHVQNNLLFRRIPARIFVVLGPLLLFFAAIGIYSVVAHNVARRITEIGVRMALGATARNVVAGIVGETIRTIAIGVAGGILVAFTVYIHVVPGGPIDPTIFLGVPAVLLLVAAAASWLPARRAAGLDPMNALRQD